MKTKMKKYYAHIWLDDCRMPNVSPKELTYWARAYEGFVGTVKMLKEKISSCMIHFDHDLGEGKSGYDCAKWLVDWCIENGYGVPDYTIHSANPVGRQNIESVFESYWKVFFDNEK
jgi:hypothetical protein